MPQSFAQQCTTAAKTTNDNNTNIKTFFLHCTFPTIQLLIQQKVAYLILILILITHRVHWMPLCMESRQSMWFEIFPLSSTQVLPLLFWTTNSLLHIYQTPKHLGEGVAGELNYSVQQFKIDVESNFKQICLAFSSSFSYLSNTFLIPINPEFLPNIHIILLEHSHLIFRCCQKVCFRYLMIINSNLKLKERFYKSWLKFGLKLFSSFPN